MATVTELLDMTPKGFKEEARRTWNRIRRLERKQTKLIKQKADLLDTDKQELRSLKAHTLKLTEAVRQWF